MKEANVGGTRRKFFQDAAIFGTGLLGLSRSLRAEQEKHAANEAASHPGGQASGLHGSRRPTRTETGARGAYLPMVTPDVADLSHEMDGSVKVFRLIAEPVKRKIAPFKTIDAWGYNGSCPGPTIQVNQGDRVRIIVENALPESTSMHWHGLEVPIEQDGVPFISQKPIAPGTSYTYEFTAHPQSSYSPHADHDYAIVLQEWAILPSNTVPNTASMEFNWLTFNGLSAPSTTPLIARLGSRVRLRFVNLGMDHHPIHLHGNQFVITGTEGGRAPESTWYPTNTVLVGVAQAKVVEFEAKYPGDWMIHCHLPHHMMNSMMDLLSDRQIQTANTTDAKALSQMETLARDIGVEHVHHSPIAENANSVPGFPQDAFMEMAMDNAAGVTKPETHGLPANWSAGMMGMMTMVRVLPDKQFEEIQSLIRNHQTPKPEEHHHAS